MLLLQHKPIQSIYSGARSINNRRPWTNLYEELTQILYNCFNELPATTNWWPIMHKQWSSQIEIAVHPWIDKVDTSFDPHAVLAPELRTLHQLWEEYINGTGNNKPAKFFTSAERGRNETKLKYCNKKVFWNLVEKHFKRGRAANDVINMIYTLLGPSLSPTAIIFAIRHYKKHNLMPLQLRWMCRWLALMFLEHLHWFLHTQSIIELLFNLPELHSILTSAFYYSIYCTVVSDVAPLSDTSMLYIKCYSSNICLILNNRH